MRQRSFYRLIVFLIVSLPMIGCSPHSSTGTNLEAITVVPFAATDPTATLTARDNSRSISECEAETEDNLKPYNPTQGAFVTIEENYFSLYEKHLTVYGINYTPRDYPGERFLTETNIRSIGTELDLMKAAGINTLRIPVRHYQLFVCDGQSTSPDTQVLSRLDDIIYAAGERGFKLILMLNVNSDNSIYNSKFTLPQIKLIAQRYSGEPAVIAYDVRQNGDYDYRSDADQREIILTWLAEAATTVRQNAPEQFVTAAWDNDAAITAPLVDYLSFQSDSSLDSLRQEIAILTSQTTKPILLAHIGYETLNLSEIEQRDALQLALEAVTINGLAGWVIHTAFDHPLSTICASDPCENESQARYGLWNTSYYPKRAVDVLKLATGVVTRAELESP